MRARIRQRLRATCAVIVIEWKCSNRLQSAINQLNDLAFVYLSAVYIELVRMCYRARKERFGSIEVN